MDKTHQFGLPLVMPGQAQKHVTLNEALVRIDALAQIRVVSRSSPSTPADPATGDSYIVPEDGQGDWSGRSQQIATFVNGGWVFSTPHVGWRAWLQSEARPCVFDGAAWVVDAAAFSPGGAAIQWRVLEFDHVVAPGTMSLTEPAIPANGLIIGVTGRVMEELEGGGLASWRLGIPGAADRYGSGLGTEKNSYAHGMTGVPMVYFEASPLLLSPEGGTFSGGVVRLAVHLIELVPPRLV